jgi:hypothetical protein
MVRRRSFSAVSNREAEIGTTPFETREDALLKDEG